MRHGPAKCLRRLEGIDFGLSSGMRNLDEA